MSRRQRGAQPRTRCRRSSLGGVLLTLALFTLTIAARATTATLIADAHLSTAQPAVNFGTLTNLAVGNGFTTLLQFDLSPLPAGTTAAQVSRATLRLFVNRADTPGLLSLAPITSTWGEYSVTASAAPTLGSSIAVAQVSSAGQYVTIDVTNTVQGWITTPATTFGLALTAGTAVLQFDSKENDLTSHPAELDITLATASGPGTVSATGPAGPQGPTGPQGLTGATGPAGAIGPQGPTGAIGPQGPAAVMNYQGLWSSLITYPANAVVTYAGSSYLSLAAGNKGNTPGLSAAVWGLLAAAGQNGTSSPSSAGTQQTLTYQGIFSASTSYASGDIVQYLGSSFISLLAGNRGNTPGIATVAWGLLAAAGQNTASTTSTTQQSLTYQGTYAPATNYALGDIVQYLGSSFVSLLAPNHGNTPGLVPTAWGLLASAQPGVTGPSGPAGQTGPAGPQGSPGVVGPQGPIGLTGVAGPQGPPGLTWQGAYISTSNYALGDIVLWQGITYTSLIASNHGNAPDITPRSWGVLASQGPAGPTGAQGPIGLTGPIGYQGLAGPPGPAGPTGPSGSQGPAGAQGLTGPQGPRGESGPEGLQGTPGQAGAQGLPGPAGSTGPQGPMGSVGPAGPVGLTPQGSYSSSHNYALADAVTFNGSGYVSLVNANVGNTPGQSPAQWSLFAAAGAPGVAGPAGASGTPGATGPQGPAGATGTTGPQGPAGPQGPPVANFTGAYSAATNYALNDAASFSGSTYVSLSAGNHGNPPDSSPSSWALLVARGAAGAAGPPGATGAAGSTGPTGATGATGPQGTQGQAGPAGIPGINFRDTWLSNANYQTSDAVTFQGSTWIATASSSGVQPGTSTSAWSVLAQAGLTGPSGPIGSAATISLGSVTTGAPGTPAQITNSGSSSAAILNFTIPAGATGPAGTGGTGSSSGSSTSGIPFASVIHSVSFQNLFYSVNGANSALNETTSVLTWLPNSCTATSLAVYSTQANTLTVTLRTGIPGAMQPSLSCSVSANGSCTATGNVAVAAGTFVDLNITGANGTAAPVWTALNCQ